MNSDVQFDQQWRSAGEESQESRITKWVIRYSGGLVKSEKQANYILLGLVAVGFIVTAVLLFGSKSMPDTHVPSGGGDFLPIEYRR